MSAQAGTLCIILSRCASSVLSIYTDYDVVMHFEYFINFGHPSSQYILK